MKSVRQIDRFLEQWQMDARDLHRRLILAPTPRERERWHAIWLLAQGWTASGTAQALGRDPYTGLPGPLAVHRGVQFLVRHHAGHPAGQGTLQLLMRGSRQGARNGGAVGRVVPKKPQWLFQSRPVHPGEEGDVDRGGLAAP